MSRVLMAMLLHHRRSYAALAILTLVGSALLVSTLAVTMFAFQTDVTAVRDLPALEVSAAMAQVEGARVFSTMMLVLVGISIASLVASSATFALDTRRRELAALRLLGAPRQQIVRTAVGEISAVALGASMLGGAVGMTIASGQLALEASVGLFPEDLRMPLSWQAAVIGVAGSVVFAAVGGVVPALRVSRARPVEALGEAEAVSAPSAARLLAGGLLVAGALWVHVGVSRDAEPSGPSLAISVLWLGALLLMAPTFLQIVTGGIAWCADRRGATTVLIAASLVRSAPRRSSTVSTPVVVVLGLLLPLGMIMAAGRAASEAAQRAPLRADVVLSGPGTAAGDRTVDDVEALSDVTCVLRYESVTGYVSTDDPFSVDPPQVRAITPGCLLASIETSVVSGDLDDVHGTSVAVAGASAVGDEVRLTDPAGVQTTFVVAAVLSPTSFLDDDILVDGESVPAGTTTVDRTWFVVGGDPESVAGVVSQTDDGGISTQSVTAWVGHAMESAGESQRAGMAMIFVVPLILALAATATSTWGLVADSRKTYERLATLGLLRSQTRAVGALQLFVIAGVALSQVLVVTLAVRSWLATTTPLTDFHLAPEVPLTIAAVCTGAFLVVQQLTARRSVLSIQGAPERASLPR